MDDVEGLRRDANRAFVRREYDRAKRLFQTIIAKMPESHEGYVGLAKVLGRIGDHQGIIAVLEPLSDRMRVAGVSRALGDAYRVLAYRGENDAVESAIRHYEEYHSQRKDPVTLFYLGELYREKKRDWVTALQCYRESWELDP
jgi:tetratricopeptide (TPR) repeat protein